MCVFYGVHIQVEYKMEGVEVKKYKFILGDSSVELACTHATPYLWDTTLHAQKLKHDSRINVY